MASKSIQLQYVIDRSGGGDVASEIAKEARLILRELTTNQQFREKASGEDIDLSEFDKQVELLSKGSVSEPAASLIEVKDKGQGIDVTTLALVVILVPPVIEHFVAPVCVHVTESIWDKLVMPRLLRRFPSMKPMQKSDESNHDSAEDKG